MFEKSGNEDSRPEGSGASKIIAAIRKFGHNVDTTIELATVTAPPPQLKVKVDNMGIELDKGDLIGLSHIAPLTKGTRIIVAGTDNGQTYIILGKAVRY